MNFYRLRRRQGFDMKINLKVYDMHIASNLKGFELEITDGSTVRDMTAECVKLKIIPYDGQEIKGLTFVVNSSLASLSTVLRDGDKVSLLRPLAGG